MTTRARTIAALFIPGIMEGVGLDGPAPHRGALVHLDVRGFRARR